MRRLISYIIFLLVVLSCNRSRVETPVVAETPSPVVVAQEAMPIPGNDTVLYYSRGACFGMCPIFELMVKEDGSAVYTGKNHVDRMGVYKATAQISDLDPILKKAADIGYFQMNAVYDNENVHDLPNIITAINQNGRLHRVLNRYKGPASLQQLYTEIDLFIERQHWQPIGANKE